MADFLGLGVRQVARYESEENEPTAEVVSKTARVFDVSADFLLGLTDNPNPHIQSDDLSTTESAIIAAFRRGDVVEAVKTIVNDEKALNRA